MSNFLFNRDVFRLMEQFAPKERAYSWDNVGLQVGSFNNKVTKILVTLDVLESVVDEAIKHNVNLIISHHPLLFKPPKQINTDTSQGRIISKLIRHDITVYSAHTNLDVVPSGVNDMLAERLELINTSAIMATGYEKLYKFAVHVPISHRDQIKQVIGDAGGGKQGDYTHCSFEIEGTGSFKPVEGADPYIGKVGEVATVEEVKIESLVSEANIQRVVQSVIDHHPYEEPAYDIIELENRGEEYSLGRIGELSKSFTLHDYVDKVKEQLKLPQVRVVGDLTKEIKKVAVIGGSGEKYIHDVKRKGADVYITGDVGFHQAQIAMEMGLAIIDAGHYIEQIMKEYVQAYLQDKLANYDVEVITSQVNTDPFQFI